MPPLALDKNSHDLTNSLILADLSDAAYCDAPAGSASFQKAAFTEATTFSRQKTNTQGFITSNAERWWWPFAGHRSRRTGSRT